MLVDLTSITYIITNYVYCVKYNSQNGKENSKG